MHFFEAFSWVNIRFLLEGLKVTLEVSILAMIFSLILGTLIALIRFMRVPYIHQLLGVMTDIIRNLPLLLIIFFTYFALPNIEIHFSVFWAAVVSLTIFEAAMLSEVIRAGFNAVPTGQMEAGLSTGFTKLETMWYIVFPQAFRMMIPAIVSQLIALIKDTSLALIISLPELTHNTKIIYSQNPQYVLPMFAAMTLLYFIVCFSLSRVAVYLERREWKGKELIDEATLLSVEGSELHSS